MEAQFRVTAIAPMDGAVLSVPLRNRRINTLILKSKKLRPTLVPIQNASGTTRPGHS